MESQTSLAIKQFTSLVTGLERWQKLVLVAGGIVVLGGVLLASFFLGNGEYVPLFAGLAPSEAQEIARKLAQRGIPYEMLKDGTGVNVPASKLDKVRMDLASEGYPRTGRQGFELFDKPNWMGSDFVEKVNYQRALEGELERTIHSLDEVEAVRVHIVLPHESLFTEQERGSKASVVLKLRSGTLSEAKIQAIRNLFANAVDHLRASDVTVIDADSQTPIEAASDAAGTIPREVSQIERTMSEKIIAALSPVVGLGKAKASVSLEYTLGSSDKLLETYDPNSVAVLTSQSSQMKSSDGSDQGVPGTAGNVPGSSGQPPATAATASLSSSGSSQANDNKTYAVSKSVTHTVEPSGMLKRITAAVLVDDVVESHQENGQSKTARRKRSPEEMKQIQDVAEAVLGIDPARGDKVVVTNLSFQSVPVEVPQPPTKVQKVVNGVREWFFAIRYAGILLLVMFVYLSLIKPVKIKLIASLSPQKSAVGAPGEKVLERGGGNASTGGEGAARAASPKSDEEDIEADVERTLSESSTDVKRAVLLKRRLVEKVKTDPEPASKLIQGWIRQSDHR